MTVSNEIKNKVLRFVTNYPKGIEAGTRAAVAKFQISRASIFNWLKGDPMIAEVHVPIEKRFIDAAIAKMKTDNLRITTRNIKAVLRQACIKGMEDIL